MNLKIKLKKFFCILSGDDYGIVSRCCQKTTNRFMGIGLFVFLVFVLCFASSYFSFTKLFPNAFVGIPIALFFAWMITNIYLLLLYTLSKNVLPHLSARKMTIFSTALRVMFICFIALVISKPLEALVFSFPLEREISEYKQQKLAAYVIGTEEFFASEIKVLQTMIDKQKNLGGAESNERVEKYQELLNDRRRQKEKALTDMQNLIERSNFYVQSIVILSTKHPSCWLITLLCISAFLAPAALKNLISEKSDYYRLKRQIETELVRGEYHLFKIKYRQLLQENFGTDFGYSEVYSDAPFNTVPKVDKTKYLTESDLISELYDI